MSAKNWTACPKCLANFETKLAQRKQELCASYGKMPQEEWEEAIDELKKSEFTDREPFVTSLRENYQIGIRGGAFTVRYRAECRECGFKYEHNCTRGV